MSHSEVDLYGPPGTGKTTRLTRLALAAVNTLGGADRLGAVTYTRAAAYELKGRIAAALGVPVPAEPRMARAMFERHIPWVGTIHSLCYRLLGRPPMISGKDLGDFAKSIDPRSKISTWLPSDPADVEGYEFADVASKDAVELALQLHAMARHRNIGMQEAFRIVPARSAISESPEHLEAIAARYTQFKTDVGKIDFEDMLELGRQIPLPVRVLLCDEVQDNSWLLWSVIDAWASRNLTDQVAVSVMAGDPWQAIYLFSGASPDLFRNRKGKWQTIGDSHRLSSSSAIYALDLLRYAGYAEDSLLSTWTGKGGSATEGGSQFYLARTNALLRPIRESLEDQGVPYRLLRGTGPLQMKAAAAFRTWMKDLEEDQLTVGSAVLLAEAMPTGSISAILPRGLYSTWQALASDEPHTTLLDGDRIMAQRLLDRLPNFDYYTRVIKEHGIQAFIMPAKTAVGTIHAAKGREADEVSLVTSWGFLPGRAISEGHHLEEACVAYVGATRHRSKLTFLYGFEGIPYPFHRPDNPDQGDNY